MRIEETIDIAATPADVWDVTLDLVQWPEWTPTVTHVEVLDAGPVRIGTRARLTQPGHRPAEWVVTELEAGRRFVWETRPLGLRVVAEHVLEPLPDGTGTRVTLAIDVSGTTAPLFGGLVRRVSRRMLPQEAKGLKQRCEAPARALAG